MLNLYRRVRVVAKRLAQPFNTREKEMSEQVENVLGALAHPDDEAMIGYRLTKGGVKAFVAVASDGTASTINYHEDPDFVKNGGRREEATASFENYGIPYEPPDPVDPLRPKRQNYHGLPDGELHQYRSLLISWLANIIVGKEIDTVVTTGIDGYDEHSDHVTMFWVAVDAINLARQRRSKPIRHEALNSSHSGAIVITPDAEMRRKKLASMACNRSQHDIRRLQPGEQTDDYIIDGGFAVGKKFYLKFKKYWPLIFDRETYDDVSQVTESARPEPALAGRRAS
jgi:LmbE family N-acetylglucosaminyl deacetylase